MKPLLVYDGDCGFCKKRVERWQSITQENVDYAPYQEVADRFPEIPLEKFRGSVQFIEPSGKVSEGAEAVFRLLIYAPNKKWMLACYEKIPGAKSVSEWVYKQVAAHRAFFSAITHFFWGDIVGPSTYFLSRVVFLRFLGFIYLIAFLSLWPQLMGLIGSHGILPVKGFLETVRSHVGIERYWFLPTLCWLGASDLFLKVLCGLGIALSSLLILDIFPSLALFFLWLIYLSIAGVSREFLAFQWDALLLETGFLAIFLAPLRIRPGRADPAPSSVILWLLKWLLFRLMFSSGISKLTSGDLTWRHLTALEYHYETQPLPTWIGWVAHQLPAWFQKFSAIGMFAIELVVPFLFFAPRKLRHVACAATIFFQLLIMATGNYCFFNLLTICLCLLLLDDTFFKKMRFQNQLPKFSDQKTSQKKWPSWILKPLALVLLIASLVPLSSRVGWAGELPSAVRRLYGVLSPLSVVNNYGLFAVMTTRRPEIIVEGSADGATWLPYEFKYKPGDLKKRPGFVEPLQPRLDWQMWFAALGTYQDNPWFINFCIRLLEGSPPVLVLLGKNPFPNAPPKYVRAIVHLYYFTDAAAKKKEGTWWRREFQGLYCPVLSLK